MWFHHVSTLEELKRQYKELALKHHPDCGGSNDDMAEINAEYQDLFQKVSYIHEAANGSTYEKETAEKVDDFPRVIIDLLRMGLTVEVCGSWLWIGGNTKPVKDQLKRMGCRWSSNKRLWYLAPAGGCSRHWGKAWDMERIRDTYGSRAYAANNDDVQKAG